MFAVQGMAEIVNGKLEERKIEIIIYEELVRGGVKK